MSSQVATVGHDTPSGPVALPRLWAGAPIPHRPGRPATIPHESGARSRRIDLAFLSAVWTPLPHGPGPCVDDSDHKMASAEFRLRKSRTPE